LRKIGEYIGGEFKILDVMHGGMGAVYVVSHSRYEDPIVLKTLLKSDDQNSLALFKREAQSWVDVGVHPNIVDAFWVDVFEGELYIAARYIPSDEFGHNTLHDRIRHGHISHSLLLKWCAQFCYSMKHALKNGMKAHRDIKPENLMVDRFGDLLITDFGLAKPIDIPVYQNIAKIFARVSDLAAGSGTPAYMSPEQIVGDINLDFHSDMYSFGCTVYEAVIGRLPFDANDLETLLKKHVSQPLSPTNTIYDKIIVRCMEKEPGDRYRSYDELLNDIRSIAAELNIALPKEPKEDSLEYEGLYRKSLSYVAIGKVKEAVDVIMEFIDKCPDDHRGWLQAGRFLMAAGDFIKAERYTHKAVKLDETNTHAWNNLGVIYRHLYQFDLSIMSFRRALEYDEYNAGAMMNMALSMHSVNRTVEAIEALEDVLKRYPEKASAWQNLGAIKMDAFDKRGAIGCFEKVLAIDPSLSVANDAIKRCESLPQRLEMRDDPQWLFDKVKQTVAEGDFRLALIYIEELKKHEDFKFKYVLLNAQLKQAIGRYRGAIVELNGFLKRHPNFDPGWYVLGEICIAEGQIENARVAYKNAQNILRKHSPGSPNLKEIESRLRQIS